ncbi:MAG: ankyrin repeat domain-containing protein [Deltaproteobacteria bacterium]|nr:ankyrin repeat domain-containing protein [Deltaproteobacteria bacterium]
MGRVSYHICPISGGAPQSDDAFIELCEKGTAEEVRSALASGANVHARDNSGWTALMWAAAFNTHPEVVQMLMAGGADVNAKDKKGGTVLMWAAIHNSNSEVVKALLKSGADIHARNKKGSSLFCVGKEELFSR